MDPFPLPQINLESQKISFQFCRTRRRQMKKISPYGNWTPEEDQLLLSLVDSSTEKKHWQGMAEKFQNKTPQQIMNRWNKVVNPSLVKGNWTQEEDSSLIDWVKKHGEKEWTKIASQLPGRIGKQCRERWFNCLKPNIKRSGWTEEEDNLIIELQSKYGNKWAQIAELIEGRTDNQVKNRWNSVLKKKIASKDNHFITLTENNSHTKNDENNHIESIDNIQENIPPQINNSNPQVNTLNTIENNNEFKPEETNNLNAQLEGSNSNIEKNKFIRVEVSINPENNATPSKGNNI